MKNILIICMLALLPLCAAAQDVETDSVWVEGRVTDAATSQPVFPGEVQFLQAGELKALVFCDAEGYYTVGWMAAGHYSLSVISNGRTLHYAELQLSQSSMLNISIMPEDTVRMRTLRPTMVTARRAVPVYHTIMSPDDRRLWNLSGQMRESAPASKASGLVGSPLRGLASWRPYWLDAPFEKTVTVPADSARMANRKAKVQKTESPAR